MQSVVGGLLHYSPLEFYRCISLLIFLLVLFFLIFALHNFHVMFLFGAYFCLPTLSSKVNETKKVLDKNVWILSTYYIFNTICIAFFSLKPLLYLLPNEKFYYFQRFKSRQQSCAEVNLGVNSSSYEAALTVVRARTV